MNKAKAVSRRILKKAIARCFACLDRWKEQLGDRSTLIDPNDIRKVLIVEMQGFGDALAVLPTAMALKEKLPEAKLSLISQKAVADLFRKLCIFDDIVPLGLNKKELGIGDFVRSISRLRQIEYDLLVVPSWSLRHTAVSLVVRSKAKVGYLHDYSYEMMYHNDYLVEARGLSSEKEARYVRDEHIITRALRTIEPLGIDDGEGRYQIEVFQKDRVYVSRLLRQCFGGVESQRFVVIAPGAVWKQRMWPMDKWKRLIEMISAGTDLKFAITGTREERKANSVLCDRIRSFNLCGDLNLSQLAALLERCFVFIGVDSGSMHLAAALGRPVVALFGPNIPEVCGPKGDLSCVVQEEMECRPCDQDYCPVTSGKRCMDLISPDEVLSAYSRLITRLEFHSG